jgi:hypothetical protein
MVYVTECPSRIDTRVPATAVPLLADGPPA